MQLISLVGSAGSGKNAVADVLIEHFGFRSLAFAGTLKDAVAAIFDWDRALLEGDTVESRIWRETVQDWWAKELGKPGFTPRMALQQFGTEVIRTGFHSDMWLLTVKQKIHALGPTAKIVITDARFPNELDMTSEAGGKIVRVKRGENPIWWDDALILNHIDEEKKLDFGMAKPSVWDAHERITQTYQVHPSEYAWAGATYDHLVENDGSLDDLKHSAFAMMKALF